MKILSKKIEKRTIQIAGSAPDIDSDILSEGREQVIQYLIDKYGYNQVCQVTNYGEFKIKSAFKDLAKLSGLSFKDANYLTSTFPKKAADDLQTRAELFKYSNETPKLKEYVKDHVDVINDIFLTIGALRNTGQHAAAIIQTPTHDENGNRMEVWDWFPCKKVDGHIVSEWTGAELDKLGFTKNDFLGLQTLDKVKATIDLVKKNHGENLELGKISTDDEKTYFYFQEGFTQDIFQFSGDGMTTFLMNLASENFDHLIAMNALYRPGAKDFIPDYIDLRHERKLPQYISGTESALKDTMGLMIYQESTMALSAHYAGFTATMADDLRKAVGKKDAKLMQEQKDKFLKGAESLGRDKQDSIRLWDMIEQTATYQFNKSHSTAYAMLGYTTMYIKAHYPMEFYTVALEYANDKIKPKILSEMNRLGEVKIMPPDINESELKFKPNFATNKIYWSLSSVKWVGEKAVENIIKERNQNGNFFSLQDFLERVKGKSVNKRAITNLIIAGAFDQICEIKYECDRLGILKEYLGDDLPDEFKDNNDIFKSYYWTLLSKGLTGLGFIDYKTIVPESFDKSKLIDPLKFSQPESKGSEVVLCGIIVKMIERNSKRGKFLTMEVEHNSDIIHCLLWNDAYEPLKKELKKSENRIIFMNGIIKFDNYKGVNSLHSFEKTKIEIL